MANILYKDLLEILNSKADKSIAVRMEAYMKNKYSFLGIKAPVRKELITGFNPVIRKMPIEDIWSFVDLYWENEYREMQYAAMQLITKNRRIFERNNLNHFISLICKKSWWDTVDFLATNGVGRILLSYPDERRTLATNWIQGENMWMRRTALIFQLKYKAETDFKLLSHLIENVLGEKEFFIQKACGWALREYSKFKPEEVRSFIETHPTLSNLARKEGSKYL